MDRALPGIVVLAACAALAIGFGARAEARTATYVSPDVVDASSLAAASRRGDRAGFAVPLNVTFALVFDAMFGLEKKADKITVFTLAPPRGDARGVISIGRYNNGNPVIVHTQNINSGASWSIGNLFQTGCGKIGGCDFLAITTDRARNGATGVIVDYIDVNGEVVQVVEPVPEPSAWALLILGFLAVAARMKAMRSHRAAASAKILPTRSVSFRDA